MMARRMIGRLRDDGRMVDGSGGWEVDNRSPENREVRTYLEGQVLRKEIT